MRSFVKIKLLRNGEITLLLMPRSHIHGFVARLATDTIRDNPYWSLYLRIASVIIRSITCVVHPYQTTEIVISSDLIRSGTSEVIRECVTWS